MSEGTEYLTKYASVTARSFDGLPLAGRAKIMKNIEAEIATA